MDLSEKIISLRKGAGFTQEELAERLDVSRQSVSKWETGQALPELDKIITISSIFGITTDSLLKPSELDELSIKTNLLERQQMAIIEAERKNCVRFRCGMYTLGIYLLFLAVYFIGHFYFEIWNASVIFAEFLIATAIALFVCLKVSRIK